MWNAFAGSCAVMVDRAWLASDQETLWGWRFHAMCVPQVCPFDRRRVPALGLDWPYGAVQACSSRILSTIGLMLPLSM